MDIKSIDKAYELKPNPVKAILGMWRFQKEAGIFSKAYSTPGHLLHLLISGSYRLRTNGREYNVRKGDIIYYHECEEVFSDRNTETVVFYSVSFLSDIFKPLPFDKRVFQSNAHIRKSFDSLYDFSRHENEKIKNLGLYYSLFEILMQIEKIRESFEAGTLPEKHNDWWSIENTIRRNKMFKASISDLCELSGLSRSSVLRKCEEATGESPSARIRKIRMQEASALLNFSTLNISRTAEYLGYGRMHEFSREFSNYFGFSPGQLIKARDRDKDYKGSKHQ